MTRRANALAAEIAASRVTPLVITPGSSTTSATQRPSSSTSVSMVSGMRILRATTRYAEYHPDGMEPNTLDYLSK